MKESTLKRLAAGEITVEQAKEEERKERQKPLWFKRSDKGGISIYGLGRFPVTLYPSQIQRLRDENAHDRHGEGKDTTYTDTGINILQAVFAEADKMAAEAGEAAAA